MTHAANLSLTLLAGFLACVPAVAAAQRQGTTDARVSCLTERDMQAVTTWLLPDGIDGLARRCRGVLPAGSFLATSGAALAERYRAEGGADATAARRALSKATGDLPLSLFGNEASGALIIEAGLQQIGAADCAKADRLTALLSPLPRASIGEVAAMVIATGLRNESARDLPVRLCRPAR
jgi:hypothetical protein